LLQKRITMVYGIPIEEACVHSRSSYVSIIGLFFLIAMPTPKAHADVYDDFVPTCARIMPFNDDGKRLFCECLAKESRAKEVSETIMKEILEKSKADPNYVCTDQKFQKAGDACMAQFENEIDTWVEEKDKNTNAVKNKNKKHR
jgi:hypothetical protein